MIQETLRTIEERLRTHANLPERNRAELLELLERLRREVTDLATTHADDARSIAGFTELSAHEATRQQRDPELLSLSLKGLSASAAHFETSHPKLVHVVNRVCVVLSNLGI